jgi:hypothetical protein
MNGRRRAGVALAGVAVVSLLAGACGGGGDDSSSSSEPTAQGLESTARDFTQVVIDGDWNELYDYMSAECRDATSRDDFVAQTKVGVQMAKAFGLDFSEMEVTEVKVRDVADGEGDVQAIAEIDGEPIDDQPTWDHWVYEDGSWHTTDCGLTDISADGS